MCGAIECIAWDGLIVVGIILLIIWILGLADVVHIGNTSGLKHIFVVLAAIFIVAWIFTRFCCGGRRRAGRRGGDIA